jgi:hypothetical protein
MLGFCFLLAQLLQWDVSADSYKAWFPRLATTSKTKAKITVRMSTVVKTMNTYSTIRGLSDFWLYCHPQTVNKSHNNLLILL